MLTIRDLTVTYPSRGQAPITALQNISLDILKGEIVVALGASGCGKSTLLNTIAGFLPATSGRLELNTHEIKGPGADRGVVFQKDTLLPWKSVIDNVAIGLVFAGQSRAAARAQAHSLLSLVGLDDFANAAPYELSGGMRQRVGIARALATNPDLLLMDEPFGALDSLTREQMQELLISVWHKTHKTIFLITHSIEEALSLGTRVIVMSPRPGRIVRRYPLDFVKRFSAGESWASIRTDQAFVQRKEEIRDLIHQSFKQEPTQHEVHYAAL